MAALNVEHFDRRTGELTIGEDKDGKPRRIMIPEQAARLMADLGVDATDLVDRAYVDLLNGGSR